jgi:DNA polymerase-3 subunit epsilon
MNNSFTAIDFETATGRRSSICQIGLVHVVNGRANEQLSILVQPPNNYYWDNFIDIHRITPEMTANAPRFNFVWNWIKHLICKQDVVAHNGFAFDFQCLKQTLEYYKIPEPEYTGHCTYKIYGESLASLCGKHNIPLTHHDALSNAMACAELYNLHLG